MVAKSFSVAVKAQAGRGSEPTTRATRAASWLLVLRSLSLLSARRRALTSPQVSEKAQRGFGVAVEKVLGATVWFERPSTHIHEVVD